MRSAHWLVMALRKKTLFLEHEGYRRRRTIDAARLIPFLGVVLVFLPLLWGQGEGSIKTSSAIVYLFGVWVVLVVLAQVVAWRLNKVKETETDDLGPY